MVLPTPQSEYDIAQKHESDGSWSVYWDGKQVFHATGEYAEFLTHAFCDGLERGITGSKQPLGARSQRRILGWMDYLEAFDTYEDYRGY